MEEEQEKDITNVKIAPEQFNDEWNEDDDLILKEWVDKSACLIWLHQKSYKKYKSQNLRQMIPVIVISTLTGAANFAIERLSSTMQKYASLVIGGFNIIAAMISTISQFLKTSELKEAHNFAAKSWDKFNRSVKIELQRHPNQRTNKKDFFTYSLKEFDRLTEISPDIPTKIINEFKSIYKNTEGLQKPIIVDKIKSMKVYEIKEPEVVIQDTVVEIIEPTEEEKAKTNFIEQYKNKFNRKPTVQEIQEFIELRTISDSSSI